MGLSPIRDASTIGRVQVAVVSTDPRTSTSRPNQRSTFLPCGKTT